MPQQPPQQAPLQAAQQQQQQQPSAGTNRPAPGYNTAAYGAQQGSVASAQAQGQQQQQQQLGNYSNVNQYGMTGYEDMSGYGGKQDKQEAYGSQVIPCC